MVKSVGARLWGGVGLYISLTETQVHLPRLYMSHAPLFTCHNAVLLGHDLLSSEKCAALGLGSRFFFPPFFWPSKNASAWKEASSTPTPTAAIDSGMC